MYAAPPHPRHHARPYTAQHKAPLSHLPTTETDAVPTADGRSNEMRFLASHLRGVVGGVPEALGWGAAAVHQSLAQRCALMVRAAQAALVAAAFIVVAYARVGACM